MKLLRALNASKAMHKQVRRYKDIGTVSLQISTQKKKTGVIAPKRFVQRLKKENELFRSYMHQDAHEFLNFLLNELAENLEKEERVHRESEPSTPSTSEGHADGGYERANGHMNGQPNGVTESAKSGGQSRPTKTWVHDIFQVRGEVHVLPVCVQRLRFTKRLSF